MYSHCCCWNNWQTDDTFNRSAHFSAGKFVHFAHRLRYIDVNNIYTTHYTVYRWTLTLIYYYFLSTIRSFFCCTQQSLLLRRYRRPMLLLTVAFLCFETIFQFVINFFLEICYSPQNHNKLMRTFRYVSSIWFKKYVTVGQSERMYSLLKLIL